MSEIATELDYPLRDSLEITTRDELVEARKRRSCDIDERIFTCIAGVDPLA